MALKLLFWRAHGPAERGLKGALSGWSAAVAAGSMTFLAVLAILYWAGATALTSQWDENADAGLTVLVPRASETMPGGPETRLNAVWARLVVTPGVKSLAVLSADQDGQLLRPWLGADVKDIAMAIPAVIAVRLSGAPFDAAEVAARLAESVPGTIVEEHGAWSRQPGKLARDIRVFLNLLLAVLVFIAPVPVGAAAWRDIGARWNAVLIASQMGATDSYIARCFSARAAMLAGIGGVAGALCAIPVALGVAAVGSALTGRALVVAASPLALPVATWAMLVLAPFAMAVVGGGMTYGAMKWRFRRLA